MQTREGVSARRDQTVDPDSAAAGAGLVLSGISKTYVDVSRQRTVAALSDVNLTVEPGEFISILGPSGCGKSTLLHIAGGFEPASAGRILVDGIEVLEPGRDRGMVFQTATLFPWKTIEANVAWPLRVQGVSRAVARRRAQELLQMVGLRDFKDAYPAELSGGMRQRASIARTLAMEPRVLLMDEPFGALDALTRELMQEELVRLTQEASLTVVFVTHDISEAVFLGDRVVVMSRRPGRIVSIESIDLPRPRHADVKGSPEMAEYHARYWEMLREGQSDAAAGL